MAEEIQQQDYTAKVRLFSTMQPVPMAIRLRDEMKKRRRWMKPHVRGGGTQYYMTLTYVVPAFTPALQPELKATLLEHEGGTLIEGELTQTRNRKTLVKQFGCIGSVVVFIAVFAVAMQAYFIALIGLSFFGLILFMLWRQYVKDLHSQRAADPQVILDFLSETADAREISSP